MFTYVTDFMSSFLHPRCPLVNDNFLVWQIVPTQADCRSSHIKMTRDLVSITLTKRMS